ncbi:hypothetical protein [Saccharothrix sp.]|uniref:hypothetical protein n=1 Tax=Saccharothrix sp. TaxID=1873460 RepID=UPI0028123E16|nr:hypothetical protein [Saccharothrix sp.]
MSVQELDRARLDTVDYSALTLARWLRDSDSFTDTVDRWLSTPTGFVLTDQELVRLDPEHEQRDAAEAEALELRRGDHVLRRAGLLMMESWGEELVLAEVSATVAFLRLPTRVRVGLEDGEMPLGRLLKPFGVRRHTYSVARIDEEGARGGRRVQRVRAGLTVTGFLVAVVEEDIHRQLFEHRVPAQVGWAAPSGR